MNLPPIVYLQTTTACNGHCRYCPFEEIVIEETKEGELNEDTGNSEIS